MTARLDRNVTRAFSVLHHSSSGFFLIRTDVNPVRVEVGLLPLPTADITVGVFVYGTSRMTSWQTHNNKVTQRLVGHVPNFPFIVSFTFKLHSCVASKNRPVSRKFGKCSMNTVVALMSNQISSIG